MVRPATSMAANPMPPSAHERQGQTWPAQPSPTSAIAAPHVTPRGQGPAPSAGGRRARRRRATEHGPEAQAGIEEPGAGLAGHEDLEGEQDEQDVDGPRDEHADGEEADDQAGVRARSEGPEPAEHQRRDRLRVLVTRPDGPGPTGRAREPPRRPRPAGPQPVAPRGGGPRHHEPRPRSMPARRAATPRRVRPARGVPLPPAVRGAPRRPRWCHETGTRAGPVAAPGS